MDNHQIQWGASAAKKIIHHLEKRRIAGSYASTATEAADMILAMIPAGSSVYRCGSMTTTNMGLWEKIAAIAGIDIIDPYLPGITPEEGLEFRRKGMFADVMITSSNAITLDGKLINLDGMGNRVAAMAFGPRKVILVMGINKITADVDAAMTRVKHYAAPVNAARVGADTPCVETGLCTDCRSPRRICNIWSIIEGHMIKDRIHVVLVGEILGY